MQNYQPSTPLRLLGLSYGERSRTMNSLLSDSHYFFRNSTKRILPVLCGLLFQCYVCHAQESVPDSVQIGKINVIGNNKTKDHIVTRELEFRTDDWVSTDDLNQARLRIVNLNLFNNVEFYFDQNGDLYDLNIIVYERWYIIPIPIFFRNDRDWDRLSYGLGVSHANFRGRNERLWLSGWLGYNPSFSLSYYNPWITTKRRIYSQLSAFSQRIKTKSFQFFGEDEKHHGISFVLGRRYGLHWYVNTLFGFNLIRTTNREMLWRPTHQNDKVGSWQISIRHDTRDLWEYPKNGAHRRFSFTHHRLLNGGLSYNLLFLDLRQYKSIKGVVLAGRFSTTVTQNRLPSYRQLYFGYSRRIRGYFNRIIEGERSMIASAELRIPLIRERFIPLSPDAWYYSFIQFMKFGVYLTLFHDTGAIWDQKEKLGHQHFLSGSGIGLNILLPYSSVLRIERAYNEDGIGETIFDAQIAFD